MARLVTAQGAALLHFLLPLLLLSLLSWANSVFAAEGDASQLYEWADGNGRGVASLDGWEIRPLERLKRETTGKVADSFGSSSVIDDDLPMGTIPPDYEKEAEDDNKSSEHIYYNMSILSASKMSPDEFLTKYYVDMDQWLNTSGVHGSKEHEHLKSSYRKAAGVKFRFKFPFYGHRLNNVTIATGGFCYVGEHTHSWLAATQYIAPLMANFETFSPNSSITYGDDGQKMIIEWSRVSLRDNKPAGEFTFQAHLFSSGDMWFVYKDVPVSIQNISDMQHPCKLGISDAYLFNHRVSQGDKSSLLQPTTRRVIHEYHRITVPPEDVKSGTVIVLTALPTCLNFTTCQECTSAQLKHFQCSWCTPKGGQLSPGSGDGAADGGDSTPFCSDQIGLNRRRQEWVEGNCAVEKKDQYCEIVPPNEVTNQSLTTSSPSEVLSSVFPATGTPPSSMHPDAIKTLPGKSGVKKQTGGKDGKSGGSGTAFLTIMALMAIGCVGWVLYAFYNPHTPSGQFLIKYRPSKWQIPSSHVRYSANMHM